MVEMSAGGAGPGARPPVSVASVVWPLMRPYRWWLLGATALGAIHGAAITFQNIAPKYLIDDILLPSMPSGAHGVPLLSHAQAWRLTLVLCLQSSPPCASG
jgi:hypothetical protein